MLRTRLQSPDARARNQNNIFAANFTAATACTHLPPPIDNATQEGESLVGGQGVAGG